MLKVLDFDMKDFLTKYLSLVKVYLSYSVVFVDKYTTSVP